MRAQESEAAIAPEAHPRPLTRARGAALTSRRPAAPPRPLIVKSWRRVRGRGLDPERGSDCRPVSATEVEHRRTRCGLTREALRELRCGLVPAAESAGHIVVIVDAEGRILWREGHPEVFRRADQLGFVEGASWREDEVGTNAIGTALVERIPVQVHSSEHYVRTHHNWTCAAAPVHDPRDGRLLGAADVSGPAGTVHPNTLALVRAVAGLAEARLREEHRGCLDRLRTIATPLLAKLRGPALVTDRCGWVAASTGLPPVDRVALPDRLDASRLWLPAFGPCSVEPLPEGVLLRLRDDAATTTTRVVLDDRSTSRPTLTVHRDAGSWTYHLSRRHADILVALAAQPAGRTAAELAEHLTGDRTRTVTVRAEMSRLRKKFGDLLDHRPYRFLPELDVSVLGPEP
ncbi:helix-turn-helix domain-containing protein [Saccharopolyspora rosea]|uniref:GAF domain-containing protein n=1 Tax=Saccharopolyspora rosea TaxID=524884 RepID=A0ABW3FQQ3_9PSEU|nr:helix-turn-helix domain-containing protein [Saccharopolyspora rosea]